MPSITSWTRLEPRCRDADMQRTVNARVFDPLWMLTRQWQVGEYRGEDAGTPISARVRAETAPLSRIFLGELPPGTQTAAPAYDPDAAPLEVMVERQPVRPAAADAPSDARKLALAIDAGLHFLRMLEQQPLSGNYRRAFAGRFGVTLPAAGTLGALDSETRARLEAMAGRTPDARRLEASFRSQGAGDAFIDPALQIAPGDVLEVQLTAKRWLDWYQGLIAEPDVATNAWQPERLEYAVSVAARLSANASDEFTLTAPEVYEGHLDWCDFDLGGEGGNIATIDDRKFTTITETVIPAPVHFRGAPAVRFWEMEDARVDYALMPVGPTDLPHLLLIEYASSYGNDWYLVPLDLPVGSLTRIRSLVVTDTFGIRALHRPIGDPALPAPNWSMFQLAHAAGAHGNLLFLAPSLATNLESPAREEVLFMRDEMANMAWAIEHVIESPIERPLNRDDPRADGQPATGPLPAGPPPREDGVPYYDLSSDVPENWVPLLPVQIPLSTGGMQTRLQRGAVLVADGTRRVRPALGEILATGSRLLLRDEEVPREGVRVTRQYELARWIGGTTFLWAGRKKQVGRGEGSSGLAFDRELRSGEPQP
jgi:hypothetical protein